MSKEMCECENCLNLANSEIIQISTDKPELNEHHFFCNKHLQKWTMEMFGKCSYIVKKR